MAGIPSKCPNCGRTKAWKEDVNPFRSGISAGIFGYPAEKAWEIAISACHNYIKEHPDTQVEIVFAVIDENIYEMGNKILSEKMDEK